jgi:TPR repeat protein
MWLRKASDAGDATAKREAAVMSTTPFVFGTFGGTPPGVRNRYTCSETVMSRYYNLGDDKIRARMTGDPIAIIAYAQTHQAKGDELVTLLRKAAALGSGDAMLRLSGMYARGEEGLEKSIPSAQSWRQKAIDAGSGPAQAEAVGMFVHDSDRPALERAARLGIAPGGYDGLGAPAYFLAASYEQGASPDTALAQFWYQVSAVQGSSAAYARWRQMKIASGSGH